MTTTTITTTGSVGGVLVAVLVFMDIISKSVVDGELKVGVSSVDPVG